MARSKLGVFSGKEKERESRDKINIIRFVSRGVSLVDRDECDLLWNRSDIQFLLYVDSWNIFFNYTTDYIIDRWKFSSQKQLKFAFNEIIEMKQ